MQGQRVPRQNFDADPAKAITTLPLAVLTNRGTADAAEILAAAVQENKRGQVVGERTYGDAAMRKVITMEDGGAIILSVAKYYPPEGGKAIQDTGVTPATWSREADSQVEVRRQRRAPDRSRRRQGSAAEDGKRSDREEGVGSSGKGCVGQVT